MAKWCVYLLGSDIYCCLFEGGEKLDFFPTGHTHVKIIRGRAELTQSKLLTLGSARVDTILRNVNPVISDMEADDGVIDTIVRSDSRDDDVVSAREKVEPLKLFFHGRLIETIMRILFNHNFVGIGFQFLDEVYGGTVLDERVWLAKESKFRMILWSDRLNMDDLSVALTKTVQERSQVFDDRLESRSVPLATFSLHIDNDKGRVLSGKLDCPFFVHEKPPVY